MTIELAAGDDRVRLDPSAGGRIASLVAGGRERLVAEPPGDVGPELAPLQWGSFVMAPWAGRIAGGSLTFDGEQHQLERNLEGHAIHGVVFDEEWEVGHADRSTASLTVAFDPSRWPFGGHVEQRVELVPGRLRVTVTVRAHDRPTPVWVGWHSCFQRLEDGDVRVGLDADEVLVTDDDNLPSGALAPVSGDTDLRRAPELGERRLDHAFAAPRPPLTIRWPDLDLEMATDPDPACAVVYTPAHEFCVEPQTGWPDALRLAQAGVEGTGVTRVEPDGSLRATSTWSWTTT